jgi:WD40 repeat protein
MPQQRTENDEPLKIPKGLSLLRTLEGHTGGVRSLLVTPDGRSVISGSDDRTARVWDLESGRLLRTLEGHTHVVTTVRVTADSRWMVSTPENSTIRVWDASTGRPLRTLEATRVPWEGLLSLITLPLLTHWMKQSGFGI